MWASTTPAKRDGGHSMTVVAWAVFVVVQLLWLPVSIVAGAVVARRQVSVSKELGVSQTAIEVLYGRFIMHIFGLREDPASMALVKTLPNASYLAYWLTFLPLWLSWKLTGARILYPTLPAPADAGISGVIVSRTPVFDGLIADHLADVGQVVILGAGMDTRAYGMLRDEGVEVFELDQPATQALKREALATAGIDCDHVTFVEVDFARSDWPEALTATGYKPKNKTLFIWEGVTLYLSATEISLTLRLLASHSGTGSVVVTDFYAKRFINYGRGLAGSILRQTDEDMVFGLDFATQPELALKAFLTSCGVDASDVELLGANNNKGPFMAIAAVNLPR